MDGSRVALVVANDQYDDPGLRRLIAPAQDAAALAEVLADPAVGGFEVQVLHNESAQGIRFAVDCHTMWAVHRCVKTPAGAALSKGARLNTAWKASLP